ncbi:MAG: tetratricopeptide repeat protein [Candidatus Zixiibacteriota bacterium]
MKKFIWLLIIISIAFSQGDKNLLEKAKTARENGRLESAQEALGDIITEYPDSKLLPEAYYTLAEINFRSGKFDLAQKHYKSVIKLQDNELSSRSYFRMAKISEKQDNVQMALFYYLQIVNFYPNSTRAPVSRNFIKKYEKEIEY